MNAKVNAFGNVRASHDDFLDKTKTLLFRVLCRLSNAHDDFCAFERRRF